MRSNLHLRVTSLGVQVQGEEEEVTSGKRQRPGSAAAQAAPAAAAAAAADAAGPSTSAAAQAAALPAAAPQAGIMLPGPEEVARCIEQQVLSTSEGRDSLAVCRSVQERLQARVKISCISQMTKLVSRGACRWRPCCVAHCTSGRWCPLVFLPRPPPPLHCPQVNSALYRLEQEGKARRRGTKQGSSKPLWWAAA